MIGVYEDAGQTQAEVCSGPEREHKSYNNAVKFHKAELHFLDEQHILRGAGRVSKTQCLNSCWVVTANSRTRPCVQDAIKTLIQRRGEQMKTGRTQIHNSRGVQHRRNRWNGRRTP